MLVIIGILIWAVLYMYPYILYHVIVSYCQKDINEQQQHVEGFITPNWDGTSVPPPYRHPSRQLEK